MKNCEMFLMKYVVNGWMDAAREKDMPETAKIVSVMVSLTKNKVAEKLFKESEV